MPQLIPTSYSVFGERPTPNPQRQVLGYKTGVIEQANYRAGQTTEQRGEEMKKLSEKSAVLKAQEHENEMQREAARYLYDPEHGILNLRGGNALGISKRTEEYLGEFKKRYSEKVKDPLVLSALGKSIDAVGSKVLETAMRHESDQQREHSVAVINDSFKNYQDSVAKQYNDDTLFATAHNEIKRQAEVGALMEGADPDTVEGQNSIRVAQRKAASSLYRSRIAAGLNSGKAEAIVKAGQLYNKAVADGDLTADDIIELSPKMAAGVPKAAAEVVFRQHRVVPRAAVDKASAFEFVLNNLEGGPDKVITDQGGVTKGGISKNAYPNVDVAKLTKEQILTFYDNDYWKRRKIDQFPENLRLMAFDMYFNGWSDKEAGMSVKEAVEEANGDLSKLVQIRADYYKKLAEKYPERHAKSFNGWMNRLGKLRDYMMAAPSTEDARAVAQKLEDTFAENGYAGAGDEYLSLIKKQHDTEKQFRTDAREEFAAAIQEKVAVNKGDYTVLTPDERSQAERLGIDVTKFSGVSDPGMITNLKAMSSSDLAALNLNDPVYRQSLSFEDHQEWVNKQAELKNPESKFVAEQVDNVVSLYMEAQGIDPTDTGNKKRVAGMREAVMAKVAQFTRSGKLVMRADINRFASEYVRDYKTIYERPGMQVFSSDKWTMQTIPEETRNSIIDSLIRKGLEVNSGNVMDVFLQDMRAGVVDRDGVLKSQKQASIWPPSTWD